MKIDGKFMLVTVNIMERRMSIHCYWSQRTAESEARKAHIFLDADYNTTVMSRGSYIITYDAMLNPVQISRIVPIDIVKLTYTYRS